MMLDRSPSQQAFRMTRAQEGVQPCMGEVLQAPTLADVVDSRNGSIQLDTRSRRAPTANQDESRKSEHVTIRAMTMATTLSAAAWVSRALRDRQVVHPTLGHMTRHTPVIFNCPEVR
jgi:hypothetical protein